MKQLFIIRHAKSDWTSGVLNDFDRPLNARGLNDAPEMASRLLKKNILIDAFVSSTANRAFTTATFFAKAFNKHENDIIKIPELYHADEKTFYDVIERIGDEFSSIALFSHNPGITSFVNELTKTQIDDMPTCGIFGVEIDCKKWNEFKKAKKNFLFFDYPKA